MSTPSIPKPFPFTNRWRTVHRRLGPVRDLELRECGEERGGIRQGSGVQGEGIANERGTVRPELGGAVTQMFAYPAMRIPAGTEGIHERARVAQEDANREGLIVGEVLGGGAAGHRWRVALPKLTYSPLAEQYICISCDLDISASLWLCRLIGGSELLCCTCLIEVIRILTHPLEKY